MKLRFITLTVALLYALLALPGMVEHHHADGRPGSHQDCAACVWLLNATTDTPVTVVSVARPVTTPHLLTPQPVLVSAVFLIATASRAPPETLA